MVVWLVVEHFLGMCETLALDAGTVKIATKRRLPHLFLVPMRRRELASFPPSCVAGISFKATDEARVTSKSWSQTLGGREVMLTFRW